jgi:hypothetical protein
MSTAYDQVQTYVNLKNVDNLMKMMYVLAFWILKRITDDECAAFALVIGYEFDKINYTISKDADTFTILQMLTQAANNVYPAVNELGKTTMRIVCESAKSENYITDTDLSGLVAKL